jgi:hypothetical protein
MRSEEEVRAMIAKEVDKAMASLEDSGDDDATVDGIRDGLIWCLGDGSRDDYDLEQLLPEDVD